MNCYAMPKLSQTPADSVPPDRLPDFQYASIALDARYE
jgi:hypothetical protein